jgi:predicted AAA+ superfamily ATPase
MITQALQQRLKDGIEIAKGLSSNHEGQPFYSRPIFIKVQEYIRTFASGMGADKRWVIMLGLRGVGKSTILAQTYLHLIKSGVDPKYILYFSVDQIDVSGYTLAQYIAAYEAFLGQSLETVKEQVYFLIDETQTEKDWGKILKTLYDRNRNFFLFTTGSSALELQASPDVARRSLFEKLYPLSFSEYRMIKHNVLPPRGLKAKINDALYASENAVRCFESLRTLEAQVNEYWSDVQESEQESYLRTGMFPFAVQYANPEPAYQQIDTVIDRIINADLTAIRRFDPETIAKIKNIVVYMSDKDVVAVHKMASLIGMHAITATNVMDALTQAELIIKIPPIGSSTSKAKKPAKFFFMSANMRTAIAKLFSIKIDPDVLKGHLLEDYSALHFYREFIGRRRGTVTYDTTQGRADFVLDITSGNRIAVEIGNISKGIAQALATVQERKCQYGLVINKDRLALSEDGTVVSIPHKFFFLA